ncbi:MAG: hypothetical protein ACRDNW_00515 [Trebonia sp.]
MNEPLAVVVKLPGQSSSANSSLLTTMQSDISKTVGVASVTPTSRRRAAEGACDKLRERRTVAFLRLADRNSS